MIYWCLIWCDDNILMYIVVIFYYIINPHVTLMTVMCRGDDFVCCGHRDVLVCVVVMYVGVCCGDVCW
jgi:hypothetical protein